MLNSIKKMFELCLAYVFARGSLPAIVSNQILEKYLENGLQPKILLSRSGFKIDDVVNLCQDNRYVDISSKGKQRVYLNSFFFVGLDVFADFLSKQGLRIKYLEFGAEIAAYPSDKVELYLMNAEDVAQKIKGELLSYGKSQVDALCPTTKRLLSYGDFSLRDEARIDGRVVNIKWLDKNLRQLGVTLYGSGGDVLLN